MRHRRRGGFTLIDLFLTVAVLIIVFGVMIDLANRVRRDSSQRLTRQLLRQCMNLMTDYVARNGGALPPITPLLSAAGAVPDEASLQQAAARNNADFVRVLRGSLPPGAPPVGSAAAEPASGGPAIGAFAGLPLGLFDERTLHDPWGSPIVFMPHQNPLIGLAPGDAFFFFSAGPDRQYLTRQDNLYSYEAAGP